MATRVRDDDHRSDELLAEHGRIMARLGLAIAWTSGIRDGKAKQASDTGSGAWKRAAPLSDPEYAAGLFVERCRTRNPVVVASASNLVLIEIDGGDDLLDALELELPETLTARSRRGLHRYYRPAEGCRPAKIQIDADGVTLSNDGYLVCPPALHETGFVYELLNGAGMGALPAGLLQRLGTLAERTDDRVEQIALTGGKVPEGHRDNFIFLRALRMAHDGMGEAAIMAACRVLGREQCEPPLSEEHVGRQVHGAIRRAKKKPDPNKGLRTEAEQALLAVTSSTIVDVPTPELPAVVLADLLEATRLFFRRFVVVDEIQADAIALWIAHTYVYDTARATPYAHFYSPEPGSGKTTALEVLEVVSRAGMTADDLTGASLFRLVDALKPTLLFDEVDAVFHAKKNSDTAADLKKILNSGYKKGKRIYRMGGTRMNELQAFDPYCPKALAGLKELPGTLAHRSIPISMQPPLPTDVHEEFDPEEIEAEAEALRSLWKMWADGAEEALFDPRLRPPKLPELDARRNEIWRILFRIADLARGRWPKTARMVAKELCGEGGDSQRASIGVRLLADIRTTFTTERMAIADLAAVLNGLDDSPWGGWNNGFGITTRELGWRLKPYKIFAKKIRFGDATPNGYEIEQFEDAFTRYLPALETGEKAVKEALSRLSAKRTGTTGTNLSQSQKSGQKEPEHEGECSGSFESANPHEHRVVPVVPVVEAEIREDDPKRRKSA